MHDYDATSCREDGNTHPGTRYSCSSTNNYISSCQTFLIFRANHRFPTISAISALFGSPPDTLLQLNNIDSALQPLFVDREVFVPVSCYCSSADDFFQTRLNYTITENTTTLLSDTACAVFEGLVKKVTLVQENSNQQIKVGFVLNVPLKCACPPANYDYYKYLVTYPLVSGDSITKVSRKFGISNDDILAVNNIHLDTTVYPETTILVPLRSKPAADFGYNFQPPTTDPAAGFLPTKPVAADDVRSTKLKKVYIVVSIIGFGLVVAILFVTALYINALNKYCRRRDHDNNILDIPPAASLTTTHHRRSSSFSSSSRPISPVMRSSSPPSSLCLSPDLLVGIKYSLCNFTVEELKRVTKDFSNECKVSENTYRGRSLITDEAVLVKEIEFSEIRHVIDLHSKINHVNILKLVGVCYNDDQRSSWSYLVMEHPAHGSLRDCLTSLSWHRRTQIAFDVATGLHYLHYCIVPSTPHSHTPRRLGSENIFVTSKWRAKLAVLSSSSSSVLEFGMVLLEILSGKVEMERRSIGFLGGGGDEDDSSSEGGCFGKLRSFMDPCLKEDYPLAEALCLGVLAKACVGNDPLHRPSMEDVLKVLARIV